MEDDVKKATKSGIESIGIFYRGTVINEWASLEKSIEFLIVNYITQTKDSQYKIAMLLLDRMTFSAKKDVLKSILDNYEDSTGFIKTKNKPYPHGKFIDELRKINEDRNKFAHYLLDTFDEGLTKFPDYIGFMEFRDRPSTNWYNNELFSKLVERILRAKDKTMEYHVILQRQYVK